MRWRAIRRLTGAHSGLIRALRLAGEPEAAVAAGQVGGRGIWTPRPRFRRSWAWPWSSAGASPRPWRPSRTGVAKNPHQVTCYAEMGWVLRDLGRQAEAERLLDYDGLAMRREITEVPGYASVESFNRDLAAYILARPDLVGDLPETATQEGQQTSDLFSDSARLPQTLKSLVETACRDYVARQREPGGLDFLRRAAGRLEPELECGGAALQRLSGPAHSSRRLRLGGLLYSDSR